MHLIHYRIRCFFFSFLVPIKDLVNSNNIIIFAIRRYAGRRDGKGAVLSTLKWRQYEELPVLTFSLSFLDI